MSYRETEAWLFSRRRMGMRYGLERMERLLEGMSHPERSFRTVHVVGSNGKGSVTSYVDAALRGLGYRTGRVLSPHLLDYRERTSVCGEWIPPDDVVRFVREHRQLIEECEATFFEVTTAMAAWHFARSGVEVAAVEAGLGGRLDATRPFRGECTVLTAVELEHSRILGGTEAEIAAEKVAIARPGSMLVSPPLPPGVERVLACRADEAELERSGPLEVDLPAVLGGHRRRNAGLAAAAVMKVAGLSPGEASGLLARIALRTRIPGRQDLWAGPSPMLFDVAHTPVAVSLLAERIAGSWTPPLPGVVGFLADKRWREMLPLLEGVLEPVVTTTPLDERALPAGELASAMTDAGMMATAREDIGEALLEAAGRGVFPVVVTGSFFVVGEAMRRAWELGLSDPPEGEVAQVLLSPGAPLVDSGASGSV